MWRHDDWINPYKEGCPMFNEDFTDPNIGKAFAYEAGADAMLEKLRSLGVKEYHGTSVFIPDEE